jgi:hypothetical protein
VGFLRQNNLVMSVLYGITAVFAVTEKAKEA